LWEFQKDEVRATLPIPAGGTCVAFAPDGKTLATGTGYGDLRIKLWDPATGKERATLEGHKAYIRALAHSPDGSLLASGDKEGTVKLWDTGTNKERVSIAAHWKEVLTLAFSPSGKMLALGSLSWRGPGDAIVKFWDVPSAKQTGGVPRPSYSVDCVRFSPIGKSLALAGRDALVVWDLERNKARAVLRGHKTWIWSVAYFPDGKTIASGGFDHKVKLWDAPAED
jgi:WD40 repeat protein